MVTFSGGAPSAAPSVPFASGELWESAAGMAWFWRDAVLRFTSGVGWILLVGRLADFCTLDGRLEVVDPPLTLVGRAACCSLLWWVVGRPAGAPAVSVPRLWVFLLELVATRTARECSVAIVSFLCFPSILPTLTALISSSSPASTHRTGAVRKSFSTSAPGLMLRQSRTCWSRMGIFPHSKSSFPPYFLGIFSISMNEDRVGRT